MNSIRPSPFSHTNIKRFIAFRALFNCRFYYPVFTILFLDYGLTIEQFSILNSIWAFTIVLAEVPSGGLADLVGRKHLLNVTSWLMITEMALLAFVPLGNSTLIFSVFLFNRILSGLAEALASGADEAMAYDTLVISGDPEDWPMVLDIQMRVRNFFYIITMTVGAFIYDPGTVNTFMGWIGLQTSFTQQATMRFPIYLTLVLALLSLWVTRGMYDPVPPAKKTDKQRFTTRLLEVSQLTVNAGKWIAQTPKALTIILFGMGIDHILRMLVTLNSQYYRVIDLPEASFGLIGSAVAVIGLVVPRIARAMVENFSAITNLSILIILSVVSLKGLTFFIPIYGLIPMVLIFVTMMMTSFFTSNYLNRIAPQQQRATILSYKGMAFNAAYGAIGILFAAFVDRTRKDLHISSPELTGPVLEEITFRHSLSMFPGYLLVILTVIAAISLISFKKNRKVSSRK